MLASSFQLTDDFAPVTYEQWRELVEADLKGVPFDKKLLTRLYEGITLQPIYTERDWSGSGDPNGFPGSPPFVRGNEPLRQSWLVCQAQSHPDPATANAELLKDLELGANALELRLDRAARLGAYGDSAEAGVGGVMIDSLESLKKTLSGVRVDAAPVSLLAGPAFLPSAALLAAFIRQSGGAGAKGSFGADPLGALAADGKVAGSTDEALRQLGALASWVEAKLPSMTTALVNTAPYHDAGATSVQDLALALATGVAYLRAMTAAGLSIDAACRQVTFRFSVGTHFFRAIAKLRAARRLWARVAESCSASEENRAMHMTVVTARRAMTMRDPWVNILRATVGCFAGAVGGVDAIIVEPYDARLGLSDDHSRRLARNTQVILQEESNLARVIDPAGGCWFLEKLTDQLAEAAWKLFQEIEAQGGMAKALESGWVAEKIGAVWQERLKGLTKRRDAITGVSEFPNMREKLPERPAPDLAALRKAAGERLAAARKAAAAGAALEQIKGRSGAELVEALIAAAEAGATLGALSEALGTAVVAAIEPLPVRPLAQPFESLRDASDAYLKANGSRPKVFLANIGPVAHHTARATYSQNFFEAGGFEVITNKGFADGEAAAQAWKESGASIAVICSSDKIYEEQAEPVAKALKAAGVRTVVLAGNPGDRREALTAAGVDLFIHIGCDVHGTLSALLKQEGVLA